MQITFKLKLGVSKRHTGGEWGGGEVFVAQSILCGPRDHSPPGSSVHRILQARTLEWVAIPFSRGSFQPRDRTQFSCIAGGFFTVWVSRRTRGGGVGVSVVPTAGAGPEVLKCPVVADSLQPHGL